MKQEWLLLVPGMVVHGCNPSIPEGKWEKQKYSKLEAILGYKNPVSKG